MEAADQGVEHGRIGVPVLAQDPGPRVLQEAVQRHAQEEKVVDVAEDGDEVRQEVGREDDVGEDEAEQRLVESRDARVAEQADEQPQEVREVQDEGRGDAQATAAAPPPEQRHR